MVLVGFFCVVGAVGLLVVGLVRSDPDLVWASIGASAVGGLAVAAASIQRSRAMRKAQASTGGEKSPAAGQASAQPSAAPVAPKQEQREQPATEAPTRDLGSAPRSALGQEDGAAQDFAADQPGDAEALDPAGEPADEPAEEDVDMADLLLVIDLSDEVLVVDLRPRYHLAGCEHLTNRSAIPLPVNEAREDGFTPCALCRPDAALAAGARQAKASPSEPPARARPRPGL